jgi:hypothetical protein
MLIHAMNGVNRLPSGAHFFPDWRRISLQEARSVFLSTGHFLPSSQDETNL